MLVEKLKALKCNLKQWNSVEENKKAMVKKIRLLGQCGISKTSFYKGAGSKSEGK